MESHYCDLCSCVCVVCAVFDDACDTCELKHPELFEDVYPDIS